jgi:hypothetical protein
MGNILYPSSFRDMNQLQDSINEKKRQIDEDQRAKNVMIQDIKRYSNPTNSPSIPASELSSRDPNSSVSDSYGIPVISAIDSSLNPSGFGTDVNRNNIKNYHANIGEVPDRTNKYLATDQYYYQQSTLYDTAKDNDTTVKTKLTNYIGNDGDNNNNTATLTSNPPTLNSIKTDINSKNNVLGKTNLTEIQYSFNKVQQQNETIENQIDQTLSNYATLNEKSVFQQKDVEFYKYTNYYLFIAFYVLLAVLGVVLFTMNFTLSFYVKIAILCVLALYPFVIGLIYQLLTILWNFVGALALGNVYNKRNDITGQADKSEVQP